MSTIYSSSPFIKRILFQHLCNQYYAHSHFFNSQEFKKKSITFLLLSIYSQGERQARHRELQNVLLWVVCRCLSMIQIDNLYKKQQEGSKQKCRVQK